jgi:hypothetical protein
MVNMATLEAMMYNEVSIVARIALHFLTLPNFRKRKLKTSAFDHTGKELSQEILNDNILVHYN